ncbi:hypothetical protein M9H77_04376 [Catharanthus roseus]|uniref:Uncharacterized protein n=1 Tax=Catharanthus roseus TaxID=4058 RepID=A0ACC0CEC1_CATRO|nr:hypothetical protein M9H77_04376 [Catharanthus roseus]
MTMRVPSYYEVHRMFYFNLYRMNNDEEMRYIWTIPPHHVKEGIHILVEFEHIQQQSIPITHDKNTTTLPKHITTVTQMVSDEPSMLYTTANNDGDEVDGLDENDAVSSQSESDDDNVSEEGEFQTPLNPVNPVNPVTKNIVTQFESSQWYSNARYDYTHSGAFLDTGSGSPIDDLVESSTVRLLDWNESMIDIQLDMRFVDKVRFLPMILRFPCRTSFKKCRASINVNEPTVASPRVNRHQPHIVELEEKETSKVASFQVLPKPQMPSSLRATRCHK